MITLKYPIRTRRTIQTFNEVRYSAGGTPHNVRPSNRVTKERLFWQYNNLTRSMVTTLITALVANAGLTLEIIDENGDTWTGIIVSSQIPFKQVAHGDPDCALWETEFEFEGVKS